jgi:glycosyl hydrolase family 26/HYDIN/CFA65/VesB family protein
MPLVDWKTVCAGRPRGKRCALALAAVLGAFLVQSAGASAAAYWGATISGETYGQERSAPTNQSAWDLFERHAGKKVGVLHMGQQWLNFDTTAMNATRARGAIPLVTMGLPEPVTLAEVASGGQDAAIKAWAKAAREWGHPFFFGPWWEMNGAWYRWGRSPDFVAAWRHFHDVVVSEGATNVTWTWITNALWNDPESDPAPYYPGDAYVDWTGIDSYNWGLNPAQPDRWTSPDQTLSPTLRRVREIAPTKPVVTVESASSEVGGNKTDWIREMLGTYLPHHPEIGAYTWFNWNFPKGEKREDWPIESSAPAQQAFRGGIQSAYYVAQAPAASGLTKVTPPPPPSGGDGPLPDDLSPHTQLAATPQVAVAPDGIATVVWSARSGASWAIFERRIEPDGAPAGAVKQVSTEAGDAFTPQVAVGPDGTATVVWISFDGSNFVVRGRRIDPNGSLGEGSIELSATGRDAAEPQVAVGADGTASVVWKRFDGFHFLVKERQIAPDGTVGPEARTLSESHQDAVEPQVAVRPDGAADVVWSRFNESNTIVQERSVAADGTPESTTHDLSAEGENAVEPQLSVAPGGTATVVWSRFDGSNWIVQERGVAAGGTPELTPHNLSSGGGNAVEPQLAVAADGTVTVVWERFDGSNFVVQSRRISPAGVIGGGAANLSASGRDAAEPQIAIGANGAAAVVWSRFDGANFIAQEGGLRPDGTAEPITRDLSAAGRGASGAQVAAGPYGAVTRVWTRFDGAVDVVQGSTSPGAALSAAPSSHDFGAVALGSSATEGFRLTNAGNGPLEVSSISLGGPNAADFSVHDTGSCLDDAVQPQQACQFSVSFEPAAARASTAVIEVDSNAVTSPDLLSVQGAGVAPPGTAPQTAARQSSFRQGSFRIGRPMLNRRRGTARLPVTVPGPGVIRLSGSIRAAVVVRAAGTVLVPIRPGGALRRLLNRRGRARLRVTVTFAPADGLPSSQATVLLLRKSVARKKHRGPRARH